MIRIPARAIIVASSISLILIIAVSLATSIEIRAQPPKLIQISAAQAIREDESGDVRKGSTVNGTGFDRADINNGTSRINSRTKEPQTYAFTMSITSTMTEDGMIGQTPTARPTTTTINEGMIGTASSLSTGVPTAHPSQSPQLPILALSYSGNGGPKHCRGKVLQKLNVPPPASNWVNGTCVDLPADARCGVFFAGKDDHCEAQLFNMPNCYNTTKTYVNTVVFMPEERPVGAIWRSMYIRCGVDAPEPGLIDPSILGGLLKKPGGP